MLVWLGRMRHSRGFGVQSPWAYRMVRYVINEHYPYYAYESLALSYPGLGVVERKMRIESVSSALSPVRLSDMIGGCGGRFVARLVPCRGLSDQLASICGVAGAGSAVVVHGIYSDASASREWRRIVSDEPGVVTFDLYYCGLVFFDEKRYKQNYIINF